MELSKGKESKVRDHTDWKASVYLLQDLHMRLHMLLFVHLFFFNSDVDVFTRSHVFDLLLSTFDNSNAILVNEIPKAVF